MTRTAVLLAGAIAAFTLTACGGFSDADIEACKQSIRDEYSRRGGGEVVDVQMVKESSRKLSGFIKIKVPVFGEFTKPCSATMGDDRQYIWRCE